MKILFINHTQQHCGVYQYGKRVSDILSLDNRFIFKYLECDNIDIFINELTSFKPDYLVYNWHSSTLPWLNAEITNNISSIKQLYIFHEGWLPNFKSDGYIMTDLSENEVNKQFSIPRPIFEPELKKINNLIPKIGSFGFGFENKGFEKICKVVRESFDSALIHLHITNPYFGDRYGVISNKVIERCKSIVKNSNIELIITNNFISNNEILDFLNNNTVNIFLYDDMPGRGLSSTIDYAISVDTPLIINNSNMFRHILKDKPEISIDNNSINHIINMGIEPIKHFRKKWNNQNMRNKFYEILQKIK
jgi:hypothetical protein